MHFKAYVAGVDKLFDAQGRLANDATSKVLEAFVRAFTDRIERNLRR